MIDVLMSWLGPSIFFFAFAPVIFFGVRMVRAVMMGSRVELHSVALAREREVRLAQNRARRLRTVRYQDEHADWNREFQRLGGGCNCREHIRSQHRESPPVARW